MSVAKSKKKKKFGIYLIQNDVLDFDFLSFFLLLKVSSYLASLLKNSKKNHTNLCLPNLYFTCLKTNVKTNESETFNILTAQKFFLRSIHY